MARRVRTPVLPPALFAGGIIDDEEVTHVKLVPIPEPAGRELIAVVHQDEGKDDFGPYSAGQWRIKVNDNDVPCVLFYGKGGKNWKEVGPLHTFHTVGVPIPK